MMKDFLSLNLLEVLLLLPSVDTNLLSSRTINGSASGPKAQKPQVQIIKFDFLSLIRNRSAKENLISKIYNLLQLSE